jgi:type VI protein secretion system component Hcp
LVFCLDFEGERIRGSQIPGQRKMIYKNDGKSCRFLKMELENVVVLNMSTGWTWQF